MSFLRPRVMGVCGWMGAQGYEEDEEVRKRVGWGSGERPGAVGAQAGGYMKDGSGGMEGTVFDFD